MCYFTIFCFEVVDGSTVLCGCGSSQLANFEHDDQGGGRKFGLCSPHYSLFQVYLALVGFIIAKCIRMCSD